MRALGLGVVIWSVLASGVVLAQQSSLFNQANTFTSGGIPAAMAVGDLNGDNHVDVVMANSDSSTISVLTGDGTGNLNPPENFSAGSVPAGIAIGRFDADDVPDVVVSNGSTSTVSFLKQYRDPQTCPDGFEWCFDNCGCIPAGQCFGFTDSCFAVKGEPVTLLGYCTGDNTIACDPNAVNAEHMDTCTVAGKGVCNGVSSPGTVAADDFNGDSILDLAVAGEGSGDNNGTLSILFGQGDGTFTATAARPAGSGSSKLVIGDFNNDGHKDVAVANASGGDIAVFLGDGKGNFAAPRVSSIGGPLPTGLAVGDVDEDSNLDIVVSTIDGIIVMPGNGHGDFTPTGNFAAGAQPFDVALADVDGDGHLDAIVANKRSADTSLLLGDGHGSFSQARTFVSGLEPLVVAAANLNEANQPNHLDVLTGFTDAGSGSVAALLNGGGQSLIGVQDFPVGQPVAGMASGDVDNDALADVAAVFDPNTVRVYLTRADGQLVKAGDYQVGDSPRSVKFGDFNRDGNLDMAVANAGTDAQNTGSVSILLGRGDGTFFQPNPPFSTAPKAIDVVVGDFNNDRIADLAVASLGNPGMVSVLLGNGDGTFQAAKMHAVRDTPQSLAVGKFNGDSFEDLVVANAGSDDVSVLLGNGDGTFLDGNVYAVGSGPVDIAVLDVNRDGFDDFAVALMTNQKVVVFNGDGSGAFSPSGACSGLIGCAVGNTPSGLVVRDFDGDGRPDLAVSNQVSNSVVLLTSTPTGRLTRLGEIMVSRQPKVITAADFHDSGGYDVCTGNASTAMNISVLNNTGATPVLRGDGNGDGIVSAADLTTVQLEASVDGRRVEDAGRIGSSPCPSGICPGPGVDANGDGMVTPQDARATATRIFLGS
jgi:FG-GAP-like repeat